MLSHKMAVATIMALSATNIVILIIVILSFLSETYSPPHGVGFFSVILQSFYFTLFREYPKIRCVPKEQSFTLKTHFSKNPFL